MRIGFIQAHGNDSRSYGIPLCFGYLAAVLKAEWDQPFDFRITSEPYDLIDFEPDVIGIGSVTSCFWQVHEFARLFRKKLPQTRLVLGGHHISALSQRLPKSIDIGVLGEGEDTFLDLMRRFEPGRGWTYEALGDVPGICYHGRLGNVMYSAGRQARENLDSLPFPLRTVNPTRPDEAIIFTSRGCPFRCTYCSTQEYWERFRRFSAEYVVRELEHIVATSPEVRSVYILDDLYVADRKRLREMAKLLDSRGLNQRLSFHGFVRSNLVDDELCECLKRMNVSAIRFGAESGSDNVLQKMERGGKCSVATHQRAVDLAHRHGMKCGASFMLGFPGETLADMQETFDFIGRNEGKLFVEGFYLTVPLPGTELWGWAAERGYVSEEMDWRKLNLSFQNPDFDWDDFLYLNDETVPRADFVRAVMQSGILPAAAAWRGGANAYPNLAVERLMRVLTTLAADGVARVALWGAGEHTRRVAGHLAAAPAAIVGLLDDNVKLHGTHIGPYRVHAPDDVLRMGAQAVVISTDRAEETLWRQRGRIEQRGIPVKRLYGAAARAREELCVGTSPGGGSAMQA